MILGLALSACCCLGGKKGCEVEQEPAAEEAVEAAADAHAGHGH